jgi:perosamine synthetase
LDGILARKQAVALELDRRFAGVGGVQAPVARPDRDHVHMIYTVKFAGGRPVRDAVSEGLGRRGIESRVYFPPVHRQPIFAGGAAGAGAGAAAKADLPVTDDLAERILSLPVHSQLTADEVADIAAGVAEVVGSPAAVA